MRCPNCGATVRVCATRWECGWCGDFGMLASAPQSSEEVELSFTVSFQNEVDLFESWRTLKGTLSIAGRSERKVLLPLMWKVLLHEISLSMKRGGAPAKQKLEELEAFLRSNETLSGGLTAGELLRKAAQGEMLYVEEAALSGQACGSFWLLLIDCLPQEYFRQYKHPHISTLISELSCIYACFSGDAPGDDLARERELEEAFYAHWRKALS